MKRHVLAGAILLALATPAVADPSYSGSVTGWFQNPVLKGNLILIDGSSLNQDNSLTAVVDISSTGDTITWGNNPSFSSLLFTPATFTNVAPDTTFKLGSIRYLNGTSDLATIIFGATLHLDLGLGIDPKDISLGVLTTQNTGTTPQRDSDFVSFGSDTPLTFNVYEGDTSSADLYGKIIGDPMVGDIFVTITPGFERTGFIGTGVGSVPEPGSWVLMIGGFALAGTALRRRRTAVRFA